MNNEKLKIALCGYLPYGGKVLIRRNLLHHTNKPYREYVKKINGTIINGVMKGGQYNYIKPLLFPISSLTKEIQLSEYNNGEPFVPADEIRRVNKNYSIRTLNNSNYEAFPLWIIDLLNRWKIDYRGLINEGLAIEVNSDNNPYL